MKEVTEMWPFLLDGITGVKKISCNLIILLKFLFSLLLQAFSTVKHSMPSFLEGIRITHICKKDGNDSNLLIVFYVQIMPDDLVMQLHRF